jgi:nucleoside-diphosphate-sugar epimerase
MSGQDVFLTGFPGFIAGRLVEKLIEQHPEDTRYLFLVEPRFAFDAQARCRALEADHPTFADHWHVIEGDIRQPDLGMTAEALTLVRERTSVVWHLAAVYDLAISLSTAYAVNVEGTMNVLDLCETLPHLQRLNYVSTCYVAGDRTGRVYEDELDVGQDFKNHYESTKCWAEKHVQRRWDRVPTAIIRPGIVVGDSRTGETAKGDGPYFVMRMLIKFPRWMPMVNIGKGEAKQNLIPVDYLVDAMARIAADDGAVGKVFQIADPNAFTAAEILDQMVKEMGRARVLASVPAGLMSRVLKRRRIRRPLQLPREMVDYFNTRSEFDVTNTAKVLEGSGVTCPRFFDYMPRLIDYARQNPEIFVEVH